MEFKIRNSGIDIIGKTPWGTHFCLFYQTKEDLIDILVPYFKGGLENNEYCMWVTSEPLNKREAEKVIRKAIPDFDKYLKRKQIEIISYTEWYMLNNEFNSNRVLNGWVDKCNSAQENGFEGLRLTGNTFWLEKKDWNDFKDYEKEVNTVIGNYQMMAICTYSLEKCGPFELLDVIKNHQFALIRRDGSWESFKSTEQIELKRKLKESDQRLKKFMDSATDGFVLIDSKLNYIDANKVTLQTVGMTKEELIGKNILDIAPNLKEIGMHDKYLDVIKTGKSFSSDDIVYNRQDGSLESYFSVRAFKVGDDLGVLFTDITERKKIEQELKESEEKWRALSENSPAHVMLLDREHKIMYINRTVPDLSKEEVIGTSVYDYTPQEFHKAKRDCYNTVWETGEPSSFSQYYKTKEGDIRYFDIWIGPVFQSGKVMALVTHSMDITKRKKKEQEMKESKEKFRALFENTNDAIFILDKDSQFIEVNQTTCERLGYSREELLKLTPKDIIPPGYKVDIQGNIKTLEEKGELIIESEQMTKDGNIFPVEISSRIFNFGGKNSIISVARDITERKAVEQELKESEEKFRLIAEQTLIGICIAQNKDLKYVNKAFGEIHGYTAEEMYEWTINDLFNNIHPDDLPQVEENRRLRETGDRSIHHYSFRIKTKSGKTKWLDVVSRFIHYNGEDAILATITDITELKEIDEKLKESKHDLDERVKELTCLYELSKLVENPVISLGDILNGTLNLIPPAFQFPDITIARITYDGKEYKHANYEETEWKLSTMVEINEKPLLIEVYFLEDKPFLKEEHDLIRDIGIRLKVTLEEKEAQNRLRESEENYRMGFESSTDGIASADMEGNFIDFNKPFLEMLGYSREELFKLNFREITPRRWHEMEDNMIISQLADGKDSGIFEKEYIRKDGTIFPVNARFWIIRDDQGDPVRMWGIVRDITESKKAEEELSSLAKFPSENPHPILRLNRNKVIYVNNSGNYLLDIEEDDEIPDIFRNEVERAFETSFIVDVDIELKDRVYSFTITPFVEQNYVNLYGMDITESKLAELKLIEINELKSEFLRRASHELKTPLISIKGYSDLILALHKDQISSEIISKLNEINRGCERLQNIINNLLKTSQLESPELKPKVQKEDLSFLIKFCVHELKSLTKARNQKLDLNIQDGQYCLFEKEEIHDVISNLLTNAIKYTPPYGKISINTEEKGDFMMISVKDNGIGFSEEQEGRIFKQFGKIERYGQGLDLGIDGTGLGLYISKRIVESHGGEIWMESEGKNKGTTFYFTIPSSK